MLDILDSWRTILDYYQGALSYSHPLLSTITLTLDWLSDKKGTSIASTCFIVADYRTRVRSLSTLVSNSLTDTLTPV